MKYKYFDSTDTSSLDKLQKKYRQLVLKLHPDKGGTELEFNTLKTEYDTCKNNLLNPPTTQDFSTGGVKSNTANNNAAEEELNTFGDVILGAVRSIRKQRAVEPQHVEILVRVTIQELYQGFKQDIRYTRRRYRANKNVPDIEQLSVNVTLRDWTINQHSEIVFKGYGDQGLFDDKADLIIKLKLVASDNTSISSQDNYIDFSDNLSIPRLVSKIQIAKDATSVSVLLPNNTTEVYPIKPETTAFNIKNKGLKFKSIYPPHSLVHGDYRIELVRT